MKVRQDICCNQHQRENRDQQIIGYSNASDIRLSTLIKPHKAFYKWLIEHFL